MSGFAIPIICEVSNFWMCWYCHSIIYRLVHRYLAYIYCVDCLLFLSQFLFSSISILFVTFGVMVIPMHFNSWSIDSHAAALSLFFLLSHPLLIGNIHFLFGFFIHSSIYFLPYFSSFLLLLSHTVCTWPCHNNACGDKKSHRKKTLREGNGSTGSNSPEETRSNEKDRQNARGRQI